MHDYVFHFELVVRHTVERGLAGAVTAKLVQQPLEIPLLPELTENLPERGDRIGTHSDEPLRAILFKRHAAGIEVSIFSVLEGAVPEHVPDGAAHFQSTVGLAGFNFPEHKLLTALVASETVVRQPEGV
jgi:hypothetical protein